ncbi:MAG: A/G-specific adenine glycosylase [Christensenellaceae bacterium]|nr:A/G-specific adenine glycosylase [Christensenellaceae bacterium]MEA5065273.1 A/G-specific adenine glycosylase [Eubacteriales bacterium]MEA5069818.1 A/G-specific adenine glycosylase [Christensenellaceae bacterium]
MTKRSEAMRRGILTWHDQNARDLPWRGARDPYLIWVSEIMLQQTRAETVIPYYRAFLEAFPDVFALAGADQSAVLKRWEGLGYYSRARSLHKAAQLVAEQLHGEFPHSVAGLRALPGVGEYTAGAIASMAYGLPEPAIDGNQVRVLSRLFDIRELVTKPDAKRRLREAAQQLIDRARPGDFNQALMGLGALVCLPRNPACERCPVEAYCAARAAGVQRQLPLRPEPVRKRIERRAVALVVCGGEVLVRRRPEDALLGGLYEFPNFLDARSDAAVREALAEWGVTARGHRPLESVEHVFTHLVWRMTGHAYRCEPCEPTGVVFVDAEALRALPMPTAMHKYREAALRLLEGDL